MITFRIVREGAGAKLVVGDREVELTLAQLWGMADALADMAAEIEADRRADRRAARRCEREREW